MSEPRCTAAQRTGTPGSAGPRTRADTEEGPRGFQREDTAPSRRLHFSLTRRNVPAIKSAQMRSVVVYFVSFCEAGRRLESHPMSKSERQKLGLARGICSPVFCGVLRPTTKTSFIRHVLFVTCFQYGRCEVLIYPREPRPGCVTRRSGCASFPTHIGRTFLAGN